MRARELSLGYVPLLDCAPLVVAAELGFAAQEGLALRLCQAPSWSAARDMLCFGQVEAAHMLSPVPVAAALGLGGAGTPLEVVSVLSVNGAVIGVAPGLAARLAEAGHDFGFDDAGRAGRALLSAAPARLRIGVPFPFSMHLELVEYWLSATGFPPGRLVLRTVPPPLMPAALRSGEIDAFCVGEPWGSRAVEAGVASLLLPGCAIWSFAPEKVLALRAGWAAAEPELTGRLVRALWRAGIWLAEPASRTLAAELLSRPAHLDLPAEIIERGLRGRIVVSAAGKTRRVDRFVLFHAGAAQFPWHSQAEWIGARLALRAGRDPVAARRIAGATFRADLFRAALAPVAADLPAASSRVEGAPEADRPAATVRGQATAYRNAFFDGRRFEPAFADRP